MGKVTSKLQITLPKAIADQYQIRPGDELDWTAAGDAIRVTPAAHRHGSNDRDFRLRLFDQATERQRDRQSARGTRPARTRGWKREDLYTRGIPR